MPLSHSQSLKLLNSFAVECYTPCLFAVNSLADLNKLHTKIQPPFYFLGEGSNTLFVSDTAPTIIKMNLKGITVEETDSAYLLTVAAGENWHELVSYCLKHHLYGLENLALIPGSVGAAPVQNIGAYGAEFADFCKAVEYYDLQTGELKTLTKKACNFAYRESIFKQQLKNRALITKVTLTLHKQWQAKTAYHGLKELGETPTPEQVFKRVIALRQSKLPDPAIIPNAGSFFKNPVVSQQVFASLQRQFSDLPYYPQSDGTVKLAAGWLIEQAGLKGYQTPKVGVHNKQALVLVNNHNGTGANLVALAKHVQQEVYNKFNILLIPEVRMVSNMGEINFEQAIEYVQ